MKPTWIGTIATAALVFAGSAPARAATPQLNDILENTSAGASIRLNPGTAVKMAPAAPGQAFPPPQPAAQASPVTDAWAGLVAQAEQKNDKTLTIEESRATGVTRRTLEVRTGEAGEKVILLDKSALLITRRAYTDTISGYAADEKGETLLSARTFVLGQPGAGTPHDPAADSGDVNSPSVRKQFADEKDYWLKNARKAK